MSDPAAMRVRRATVEDLNALVDMWSAMRHDVVALEKRLTEFQVAESSAGQVLGTVGFQIIGRDAVVHHEAFSDYGLADAIRSALWERLQKIAGNHGLCRVWTREESPFWSHNGFLPPSPELLQKLPAGLDRSATWLAVQLREDPERPKLSAEEDFEKFLETEREKTGQVMERAKTLKAVATLVAVILFLGVMALTIYLVFKMRTPAQ
jgi:N-acetylglutamate synthase-like GNAT family acetyltransferase